MLSGWARAFIRLPIGHSGRESLVCVLGPPHNSATSTARIPSRVDGEQRRDERRLPRSSKSLLMSDSKPKANVEEELKQLETRLDALVAMVAQLQEENRALRQRMDSMMTERATLLQKNEQVRARVEAMIGRLKAMEHSAGTSAWFASACASWKRNIRSHVCRKSARSSWTRRST